jgi:small GTP-binding protein
MYISSTPAIQLMPESFQYDVFLSHSSKDKSVVRPLAERLRKAGLNVFFDESEILPGDSIPSKIEYGLEHSRVLVLCMSANAFGSDWATLESQTFRFRDPLNKERRFIPLRLDEAPLKGSLAQFLYIKWLPYLREQEYPKLLESCCPPDKKAVQQGKGARHPFEEKVGKLKHGGRIRSVAFSADGQRVVSGDDEGVVRLWDLESGRLLWLFVGHVGAIRSAAFSRDRKRVITGGDDSLVRVWDVERRGSLRLLKGHTSSVTSVSFSTDGKRALSGGSDSSIRMWDVKSGRILSGMEVYRGSVNSVAWSADGKRILSGSSSKATKIDLSRISKPGDVAKLLKGREMQIATIQLWDVDSGQILQRMETRARAINGLALSPDGKCALSGDDNTVLLWDAERGRPLIVLEGHTSAVNSVAFSADGKRALSGGSDGTLRLWDLKSGRALHLMEGGDGAVCTVALSIDGKHAYSATLDGVWHSWSLSDVVRPSTHPGIEDPSAAEQVQYTNAKVLLVGESGAGKTGLSKVLAGEKWHASDSTVGAWATQWKLPVSSEDGIEREIWLWDFGGQADQRLIHQLYMEDTALAVLVFDGQKEDLFETLGQWDRDLTRASRNRFTKVLVAGRVDAGGLRASKNQVETFRKERGFVCYLETSAKANLGCHELKEAILNGIRWADIPWRSSPLLFKGLKEEIIRLKDEGRVLMRFNELRDALHLRLVGDDSRFKDEELKAVVGLLAGPGVVWELAFGSWVLLQPERINAYAQAVIQTLREDKYERGCLPEERVLNGDLTYHSSLERLAGDEERFVLLAMHQTLVDRGLCLREHTDKGPLLIFPSYYRRERPELVGHPAVLVTYRFNGFLDDIYSTLVVRLHHTKPFQQDELWRCAADFKTLTGKQLGVKLTRRAEGAGELEVYFDPKIPIGEKIIFSKYVHEHLLQNATDVVRLRHYVCPHCGTPAGNREVAMKKLEEGRKNIPCVECDDPSKRIPLWDQMEELFASPEIQQKVHELQEQSTIVLDTESKERALVGEVISTVALAGQISREFNVSDHGIDMEVELKSVIGEASGRKLYLQLKSGDSYLRERKSDGAEVFNIKDERHVRYWMAQAFPVLLIIRNSEGEVRWMEVRDWLKRESDNGKKPVRQIIFKGERFDVMSVRRWREKLLGQGL